MRSPSVIDARFTQQALFSADDHQFSLLMAEVDARLKKDGVPIFARQLRVVSIICQRGGFSLSMSSPLAGRIKAWFDAQYGERLKADLSLGYGPVEIRGDLFKMQSPWLIEGGQIVCIAGRVEPSGALPIVNVLKFIVGLTDQLARDLTTVELDALQQEFLGRQAPFAALRYVQNNEAFKVGLGDLKGAVDFLFQDKPQLGSARWACLQAVEKFLKGWIAKQGGKYPTGKDGHNLNRLNELASNLNLSPLSNSDIADVQCPAGVRYGESPVANEDIVAAFNAALRCCALIASEVAKSEQGSAPYVGTPEPNALTREQFLSLKVGDLLRCSGLHMTIVGVDQDGPRWYRTRVIGASSDTRIIEDDFASFALVRRGEIWLR